MNSTAPQVDKQQERARECPIATLVPCADHPALSVVVPAYNCPDHVRFCLSRLANSKFRNAEVIVIDDASTDETADVAKQFGARVIRMEQNAGPGSARNRAVELAHGELVFFIDADVGVHPDTLGAVVQAFEEDPGIDALFGSYDESPAAPNLLSQYRNLLHHWTHQQAQENATTFWTGCGAARRSVFLLHGGFDNELYVRPSIEDIEFGMRLSQAGHRIHIKKNVQVTHLKCWRMWSMIRTDVRDRAIPWAQLMYKQGAIGNDLNTKGSQRISALFACTSTGVLIIGSFFAPLLALLASSILILILCVDSWTMDDARSHLVHGIVAAACISLIAWIIVLAAEQRDLLLWLLLIIAALLAMIVVINRGFYGLLLRVNGPIYAMLAVPLHASYFAYGSGAFALTFSYCRLRGSLSAKTEAPP